MNSLVHPAVFHLLREQARAKMRRRVRSFATPRKLILSILGLILGIAWISNAIYSIFAREALPAGRLESMIPLGLLTYSLWHVLHAACKRPVEGIEWTESERELLCGGPFRRTDLIAYKFGSIVSAGLLKATCFSVLMIPDLSLWLAGFVGFFLGLVFVDLIRLLVEITVCGISDRAYQWVRSGAIAAAIVIVVLASWNAYYAPNASTASQSPGALGLVMHVLNSAGELRYTPVGRVVELPFRVFGAIVTANDWSAGLFGWASLAVAMVVGLGWLVVHVDQAMLLHGAAEERRRYPELVHQQDSTPNWQFVARLPNVWSLYGAGPIAWRQFIGLSRYPFGLVTAMLPPVLLSCLPALVLKQQVLLNVVGATAFYSFLLLPTALKFDFRRDIDRIATLKTLPIRPISVVLGQIATPIMISLLYQATVLTITMVRCPYDWKWFIGSMLMFLPMNVLVFGLDNLIFLLYPHRIKQEGLEVFIRATLTFTGKGILFMLTLVAVVLALFGAKALVQLTGTNAWFNEWSVLLVGGWTSMCLAAFALTRLMVAAYNRFDPSQDVTA